MLPKFAKIKGLHPGDILNRELKIQGIKASELAKSVDEHKQTISAIINKRRAITPKLSIKLAKQFNVDKDYFMLLQASYDIKKIIESEERKTPNINNFRKILFWDTTIDKINWDKHKKVIIKRVLERGNSTEINELISFYGKKTVSNEVRLLKTSRFTAFEKNIKDHELI